MSPSAWRSFYGGGGGGEARESDNHAPGRTRSRCELVILISFCPAPLYHPDGVHAAGGGRVGEGEGNGGMTKEKRGVTKEKGRKYIAMINVKEDDEGR